MTRTHLLVTAGLTFLAIGAAAAALGPLPGDVPLRTWLVTGVPSWLATFLGWMTHAGDWRVVFPATSLLLVSPRIRRHWWIWLPVGTTISLFVLSVNFIGDGLRDATDPTQQG